MRFRAKAWRGSVNDSLPVQVIKRSERKNVEISKKKQQRPTGFIVDCTTFPSPSWSCQWTTVACTPKSRYFFFSVVLFKEAISQAEYEAGLFTPGFLSARWRLTWSRTPDRCIFLHIWYVLTVVVACRKKTNLFYCNWHFAEPRPCRYDSEVQLACWSIAGVIAVCASDIFWTSTTRLSLHYWPLNLFCMQQNNQNEARFPQ